MLMKHILLVLSYGVAISLPPGKESSSQVHPVPVFSTAAYSVDIGGIQSMDEKEGE